MTAPDGAPFDADRVENLVTLCLGAIVSAAASFSPVIALPSRQIAGAGLIPYDCEQVFASVITVGTGAPEGRGITGSGTWPPMANGGNMTVFYATVQLAIVRNTLEKVTGLGQQAPAPSQYQANLGLASQDMAILWAAIAQIEEAQMSATPTTESAGNPSGGLVATSARISVLV